jgi:hypothetical protein
MNDKHIIPQDDLLLDATKKSYTIIDNWIFQRNDLSVYEKMVYIVLKKHAWNNAKCFPSQNLIAEEASISIPSVKRNIKNLIKKELLLKVSNQKLGKSNLYFLCDPSTNMEKIKQLILDLYPCSFDAADNLNSCKTSLSVTPDIKNSNNTTQKCACVCFNCKKEIEEINLINSGDLTIEVCSICNSELIMQKFCIPVSKKCLTELMQKYKAEKLIEVIDLINFQYNGKAIRNFYGLLKSLLESNLLIHPEDYIPYLERKKVNAQKNKQAKQALDKKRAEENKIKEEKEKRERAKLTFESLTPEEQIKLLNQAKENLPTPFRTMSEIVQSEAYNLLME